MTVKTKRVSHVEADRPLARQIGARLRQARFRAALTQAALAAPRYTKAYVSALENGTVKPSMAALSFFASRLQVPIEHFLADRDQPWTRLEADLQLAAGHWDQAVAAFTDLLDEDPSAQRRADLLVGLAEGLARLGRGREALRAASESSSLFTTQGRHREAAWATYWQAAALYDLEQGDQAAGLLTRLLDEIAAGLSVEPDLPVRIMIALAMVATRDEQPERALGCLEQARARVDALDDQKQAVFNFSLALRYRELGDFEAAISTGSRSLAQFQSADAKREAASIHNELALVYLRLGSFDRARHHVAEARAYFTRQGDTRKLANVTETEGQIALAAGSLATAIELAGEALRLSELCDDKRTVVDALLLKGRAHRASGDLPRAAETLEHAAALAEEHGRRRQIQTVLGEWGDVMADQGDLAQAYALSRRALDAGRA